jgi:hypothetical protein
VSEKDERASSLIRAFVGDAASEVAEVGLDHVLAEGVLKDLPIVGIAVRALAAGRGVHDALLLGKFIRFFRHIEETTEEERAAFLAKLDEKGERERMQRNLLLLLDRIEQEEKAPLLARVFTAMVRGEISPWQLPRYSSVILGCTVLDLRVLYHFSPKVRGSPLPVEIGRRLEAFGLVKEEEPPEPFALAGQQPQPHRPASGSGRARRLELSEMPVTLTPFGAELVRLVIRKEDFPEDDEEPE